MKAKQYRYITYRIPFEVYDLLSEGARQAYGKGDMHNVARLTESVMNDIADDIRADKAGETQAA